MAAGQPLYDKLGRGGWILHRVADFGFNPFLLGGRAAFSHAIRRLARRRRKYEKILGSQKGFVFWLEMRRVWRILPYRC